jgi:integrase
LRSTDGHVDGLELRVTPTGIATWSVLYTRPLGGRARFTIGPASEVGLAEAREQALDIRSRARRGEDPHFDKRAARFKADAAKQQITVGTVAELANRWLASREARSWRPATVTSFKSLLKRRILPAIGNVPAPEVTRADVRALLERVHDSAAMGSNRAFEVVRRMWNWARSKDLVTSSPCDGLKKIEKERRRERTYTDEEVRAIVAAVKGTEFQDVIGLLLRTGTRSHEARSLRWDEIDVDRRIWLIPAGKAKAGRKHEVPLAKGAWALIQRRLAGRGKEAFVFAAETKACSTCREAGHVGAPLHRRLRALSIKAGLLRNTGTAEKPKWEGEPIHLHDLRRTVGPNAELPRNRALRG